MKVLVDQQANSRILKDSSLYFCYYLENPHIQDNLAFSFQAQVAANEYYPGLARKVYLKAYRYNLHLKPKSMLIELGAQNNTVEEIMNACDPLAHILAIVLDGVL